MMNGLKLYVGYEGCWASDIATPLKHIHVYRKRLREKTFSFDIILLFRVRVTPTAWANREM